MPAPKVMLNARQQRFADEWLTDYNGKRSAIAAGYAEASAEVTASQLLRTPKVKAYIDSKRKKLHARLEISQKRTITEMARLGFADPRRLFNEDGSYKMVHELDDDIAAAISSIEFETITVNKKKITRPSKITFHSKSPTLGMLGKHFKIFEEIAPPPLPSNPTININALDAKSLKLLLELKKSIRK